MDINIKSEPIDNIEDDVFNANLDIKVEGEVMTEAECHWTPAKFENEENEYYHDFVSEFHQDVLPETSIKNESVCEQFTVEYLDDPEDYDDCENDPYAESADDSNVKIDSEEEDNYAENDLDIDQLTNDNSLLRDQEGLCNDDISDSNNLFQLDLKKWINYNYIKRECPVCNKQVKNYNDLRKHVELNHKESIEESESNYHFSSDNCGVCKKCNQEFVAQFSRYVHTVKHEDAAKLDINICKICDYTSKIIFVQKHIVENHPEVLNKFKTSSAMKSLACPICSNVYMRRNLLWYHFLDKHPQEYKKKFSFNCHLCKNIFFSDEEDFLQHLIVEHEFNSLKILNFRKIFEDKNYIACGKCNKLFFQNDMCKLLRHYLKHQDDFYWSCKFCRERIHFKMDPVRHMCAKMLRYYKKYYEINSEKNLNKSEGKLKNLQEFEEHIAHVCPFCNKEFGKMVKWQQHLKADHKIDTLKGLEMRVISSDSSKLSCVICHTVVANSPEKLHAHRFLHLPYKPYKCLKCSVTLNNFKMAINHVSKRCQDEHDRRYTNIFFENTVEIPYDIQSSLVVQCSLCNCQSFSDFNKSVFKHYEDEHNHCEEFFLKHSENSMTCKICNKQYVQYDKNTCFLHLRNHFDEKPFKCKLCLLSYPTFKGAYQHLMTIHDAKPLNRKSTESNIRKISFFLDKEDNVTHVSKQPQIGKSTIKSRVLNEFGEFINYACPECNESMATQDNWHTHISSQHNFFDEINLYVKNPDGSLKCPTCDMILVPITTAQQKHKLTHMPYKSFMCNLCYARFNTLGILYAHLRRKHFLPGKYECPVCPKVLETPHQRTEHIKADHPRDEWPDSMCLICYRIFPKKSCIKSHMITHDGERLKHTCHVCRASFFKIKHFKSHLENHKITGEIIGDVDEIATQSTYINPINQADDMAQKNIDKRRSFRNSSKKRKIYLE